MYMYYMYLYIILQLHLKILHQKCHNSDKWAKDTDHVILTTIFLLSKIFLQNPCPRYCLVYEGWKLHVQNHAVVVC